MTEAIRKLDPEACRIIEAMDGPAEVARVFEIETAAVSQWKYGIPKARLQTIKLMRPDLFPKVAA